MVLLSDLGGLFGGLDILHYTQSHQRRLKHTEPISVLPYLTLRVWFGVFKMWFWGIFGICLGCFGVLWGCIYRPVKARGLCRFTTNHTTSQIYFRCTSCFRFKYKLVNNGLFQLFFKKCADLRHADEFYHQARFLYRSKLTRYNTYHLELYCKFSLQSRNAPF